jgi:hypothetical protein
MSEQDIIQTVGLYSVALDSHSWDLFDAVFAPNVVSDYPGGLFWRDLASFKADFTRMHEPVISHQHHLGMPQVVVDGNRAWTLTYGTYRLLRARKVEKFGDMTEGGAWYDDELQRTPAGWRIVSRKARNFWWRGTFAEDGDCPVAVNSFPEEAAAGRVGYINALRAKIAKGAIG